MDMRPLLEHEGLVAEPGLATFTGGRTAAWTLLPVAQTHHQRQPPSGPAEHKESSQTWTSQVTSPKVERSWEQVGMLGTILFPAFSSSVSQGRSSCKHVRGGPGPSGRGEFCHPRHEGSWPLPCPALSSR